MEQGLSGRWLILEGSNTFDTDMAASQRPLFASPGWAQAIASLGATPVFVRHRESQCTVLVAIFRRAGLRIGVLGLPVAGLPWDDMPATERMRECRSIAHAAGVDLLRVTVCGARALDSMAVAARQEVWCEGADIEAVLDSKRVKRDLAYARRSSPGTRIIGAADYEYDGRDMHALYATAVSAHGGALRYGAPYFSALGQLARSSPMVRVFLAREEENVALRGFAVLGIHAGVGYYLHGAVDEAGRREGISDLLLHRLMECAIEVGCSRVTLMASPWTQPGLIKFKSKWGTQKGLSLTYDMGVSALGTFARVGTLWLGRHDRRAASKWAST